MGPPIEQVLAVASPTEGRVEHEPRGHRLEERRDLLHHHREVVIAVVQRVAHRAGPRVENRWAIFRPSAAPRFAVAAGMSPRTCETEAGGVWAVHLAGREAADGRVIVARIESVLFSGGRVLFLLLLVGMIVGGLTPRRPCRRCRRCPPWRTVRASRSRAGRTSRRPLRMRWPSGRRSCAVPHRC